MGTYPLIAGATGIGTSGFVIGNNPGTYQYTLEAAGGTLSLVVVAPVPPDAPQGLAATGGIQQIALQWSATSGADSYTVKRSTVSGSSYGVIASGLTSVSFTDTGLGDGVTRHYVVTATNGVGEGTPSAEASATTRTALESWRQLRFGSSSNSGDGADLADPDKDGRPNLIEYATGTDPLASDTGSVVTLGKSEDGQRLTLGFHRIADPALTYTVEADGNSALSNWTPIWSSTGSSNTAGPVTVMDDSLIGDQPKRFLRLRVTY
ncbi:MAG: hypothetical protein KDN05_06555 [Verrucomicrobiae bacterium]|nr:hypothetical protein [Verrucomicrobiae bacterium]MCP5532306.1 hypothetical protein [Akkermansiaceae bacterium]